VISAAVTSRGRRLLTGYMKSCCVWMLCQLCCVAEYVWGRDKDQAPGKGMHSIWETYTLDLHGSDRSAQPLQLDVYENGMEMLSR